jgi:hypothetical protein
LVEGDVGRRLRLAVARIEARVSARLSPGFSARVSPGLTVPLADGVLEMRIRSAGPAIVRGWRSVSLHEAIELGEPAGGK